MEKRYQVFISSTFQDLQNARQEVSQALLRADCFPAGMELFPAADEEQFEFIKTVIDQSDYYIIISAGRYGSIHPESGLSYTEMEYDYAVEASKPVIRLLHRDPFNLLRGEFIEKTEMGREALDRFRAKLVDGKLVKFWANELELGSAVDHSLRHTIKVHPAEGWVRSSHATAEVELENYKLREKIASFEARTASKEERLERIFANLGLSTVSIVLGNVEESNGIKIGMDSVLKAAFSEFSGQDWLDEKSIDRISGQFGVDAIDVRAILGALVEDGYLRTDSDGDFFGEEDLRRLEAKLPLITVMSR